MSDYSSTTEVKALTRMYLVGESAFNSTTVPTATELTKFIERACGVLNVALASSGFVTPVTEASAKLACDEWVTLHAAQMVELSQPTTEFAEVGNNRTDTMYGLERYAVKFVEANMSGFQNLGVAQNNPTGQGVQFTAQLSHTNRADPSDSTLEQPHFRRRQFDAKF